MPRAKKNKTKTLINYIIDESGSMWEIAGQVRSGFNEYIEELRKTTDGEVAVTLTKFSTFETTPYVATPLAEVPRLDENGYNPSGSTALYDAVANTIKRVDAQVDSDTKVITVIMTDGEENSSRENNQQTVSALIAEKQKQGNWTFVFLGSDQDAWDAAQRIGISRGNTVSYTKNTHSQAMRGLATASSVALASSAPATMDFFADAGQSEDDYLTEDEETR